MDVNFQWARFHATNGGKVFPCHAGGPKAKQPIGHLAQHSHNSGTTDLAQIEAWWRQCPNAAVGLATPDKVVVIDLDLKLDEGKDGVQSLRERVGEAALAALFQKAVVVCTPSGGWHLYVAVDRCEDWLHSKNVNGLQGVDLRVGGKGYTIAPGTVMAGGGAYQCWG